MKGRLFTLLAIASIASTSVGRAQLATDRRGEPNRDSLRTACEYGVTMALLGNVTRADSVFVWLLSRSSRDPRALNNLGNLALLEGEPELALSFYARAAEAESTDAGIVLNQATALMLSGDDEAAQARAALGVRLAGGPREAGRLLGLRYAGTEGGAAKGSSSGAYLSKEELTALLKVAAGHVPRGPGRHGTAPDSTVRNGAGDVKHRPVWRSAGARAGDQDAAALVYWKD